MHDFTSFETILFSVLLIAAVAAFIISAARQVRIITAGRPDPGRFDDIGRRIGRFVREVLAQVRVIGGRPVAGTLHALVFFAFLLFALETSSMFGEPFGLAWLPAVFGSTLGVLRVIVHVFAVLCTLAILGLAFRRFVLVRYSPDPKSYESGLVALLIVVLMLTYIDLNTTHLLSARLNWWLHVVIILSFPLIILHSKHRHIFLAPIAVFLRRDRLWDVPPLNLDFEAVEDEDEIILGLETMTAVPWKLRLDFLACVECKRCTDNCPAAQAGQELRPADFIKAGQKALLAGSEEEPVIGTVISETALGQCTTCMACENICPVGIEHSQLLAGAKFAQTLALGTGGVATEFFKAMNNTGNPFSASPQDRSDLIAALEIPYYESGSTDYLLWLGCVWSYNPDFRSTVEATVALMKKAGVSFGVLRTEGCSGHHSRRQGEEMQFQMLAGENCGQFIEQGVKRIVTGCPHCVNTFRHEYASFLADQEIAVLHHSELFARLVDDGSLRLKAPPSGNDSGAAGSRRLTYHDPCYLGRYEGVFSQPRALIRAAGHTLVEAQQNRARSYCCGGGAAGFTLEAEGENRVDQERKRHLEATGTDTLVTSCPECRMMLAGTLEETFDIAEIVLAAVE